MFIGNNYCPQKATKIKGLYFPFVFNLTQADLDRVLEVILKTLSN